MIAVLIGMAIVWGFRQVRRKKRNAVPVTAEDQACHALLAQMDRLVATLGYTREAGETILQFSKRVGEENGDSRLRIHDWYRHYSEMRYNPAQVADAFLPQLVSELEALKAQDDSENSL